MNALPKYEVRGLTYLAYHSRGLMDRLSMFVDTVPSVGTGAFVHPRVIPIVSAYVGSTDCDLATLKSEYLSLRMFQGSLGLPI